MKLSLHLTFMMALSLPAMAAQDGCAPGAAVPEIWPDPRTQPVCGLPPASGCRAGHCNMIAAAPTTYAHCPALRTAGATFVSWGRCRGAEPPEGNESKTIVVGLKFENYRECVAKVNRLDRVPVDVAPWIKLENGTASRMSAQEFCRRLFSGMAGNGIVSAENQSPNLLNPESSSSPDGSSGAVGGSVGEVQPGGAAD